MIILSIPVIKRTTIMKTTIRNTHRSIKEIHNITSITYKYIRGKCYICIQYLDKVLKNIAMTN